jgi:hypothetical protein
MGEVAGTMFGFEGRGHGARMVARAPVIPGPDRPAEPRRPVTPACSACGYGDPNGVLRRAVVVDRVRLIVCVDWSACTRRYRDGTSPQSYAAGLRGEILAVAP